jgi:glycine cleavage system H protein
MSSQVPEDLRYTKDHEWARREGDLVVVGITAHAVEQLGDITLVTLPDGGAKVGAGERFGDVDSVKAVSELYAPLAGEIVEKNPELDAAPERVNEDPYGAGWMIKIRPTHAADFDALLAPADYEKLL